MATLSLHPSPHALSTMTSSRVPLRDAPSAVLNSPLRPASTAIVGHKRPRQDPAEQRDALPQRTAASRPAIDRAVDQRLADFVRRHNKPTDLQRKLEASRRNRPETRPINHEQNRDDIVQWQNHYRKLFPSIKFYFEGIPKELANRLAAQVKSLGATEVIFFSKDVTHIITMRQVPSEIQPSSSSALSGSPQRDDRGNSRTINPSLLENNQRAPKLAFEAPMTKKMPSTDVLLKAKEMGIKIWTVEKLQRMLQALFNGGAIQDARQGHARTRIAREAELSQLLRNEKKNTAADKDWMSETVSFRGCFIYVRDMEERTKPAMIRDYPKVERKELGKWPQLRVTAPSRCPFIDDPPKRSATLAAGRVTEQVKPRTRATTAAGDERAHGYLKENPNPPAQDTRSKPLDPPRHVPVKRGSTDQLPLYGSAQASLRAAPRFVQGEPIASGVQPSNITSAVRSQMISSTAAIPGGKAGTSRGLNVLKRKVLELDRDHAAAEGRLVTQMRAAINDEGVRSLKRKALIDIAEEEEQKVRMAPRKKRVVEKECKPGYCENCREKFDDFDDHIVSRTHRKFAQESSNFSELDALLSKLERI